MSGSSGPAHLAIHRHRLRGARGYPLVCILQTRAVGGPTRIVAPLATAAETGPTTPRLILDGAAYAVLLRLMLAVPLTVLADQVGTAEPIRAEIGRGLDLLFFGI